MDAADPVLMQAMLAHEGFVRSVARAVLGGEDRVDDVVQETWTAALERPPRERGALRGWLGVVARNFARAVRRRDRARDQRERVGARSEALPSADEIAEREETRRTLVTAVLALEEPYRTTLLLRYYQGLSVAAVADRLAVPLDTAKTRLRRGLSQLRARLGTDPREPERVRALAFAPLAAASATTTLVGTLGMKKVVVAAVVLLAVGIGFWQLEPWVPRPAGAPTTGADARAAPPADVPTLLGANRPPGAPDVPHATKPAEVSSGFVLRGRVTDRKTGEPIAGASIHIAGMVRIEAQADGTYELPDPGAAPRDAQTPPDARRPEFVEALAPGYVRGRSAARLVGEGRLEADFQLRVAASVTGRIVDQNGAPVAGVNVYLLRLGMEDVDQPQSMTDALGRFAILEATPDEWNLNFMPPRPQEDWEWPSKLRLVKGGDRDVEVVITRLLPGTATLTGEARDATTGAPLSIEEALLIPNRTVSRAGQRASVLSDVHDLRVRFERVRPGSSRLWVRVADGRWGWSDVEVAEADGPVAVSVPILKLGAIHGRVEMRSLPQDARPVVLTLLLAARSRPGGLQGHDGVARVPPDGEFQFPGVMAGRHRVTFELEGWVAEADVEVRPESTAEVTLTPVRGAILKLRSVDPFPKATSALEFSVAEGDGPWGQVMRHRGTEGKPLEWRHTLRPGRWRWRVRFDADDFAGSARDTAEPVEGEVTVVAGQDVEILVPIVPK